jgi:LPXTG-motif cell wall-anchored protein
MKARIALALMIALILSVGVTSAQESKIEIKNGQVLKVEGNTLIVRTPEGVKSVEVPNDFRFDMNGRKLAVGELKPGMTLTAMITTTEKPVQMTATEIRTGTVVHNVGGAVVIRNQDGELKKFTTKQVRAMNVTKDGKPIDLQTLRVGDTVSATVVTQQPPTTITEKELKVFAAEAPQPRQVVVSQAQPAPKPEPERRVLPKTASPLPLVGLAGLALIGLGAGLTAIRRRFDR